MTVTESRTFVMTVMVASTINNVATLTETENLPLKDVALIPGLFSVPSEVIPAMVLGFVLLVVALLGSALVLRSRSLSASDELNRLRTRPTPTQPETDVFSSLKQLLELGVLTPTQYMEKKILAEQMEKKLSAKQLLDRGYISQAKYDALTQEQE